MMESLFFGVVSFFVGIIFCFFVVVAFFSGRIDF